jgi:hypothetical protein
MDYLTFNDGRMQSDTQYNKRRSKSICAPQNISLDKLASVTESFSKEKPHSSRSSGSTSGSSQSSKVTGVIETC